MSKNADEECKKKRSPDFTGREKSTLLNLIYTYKSIIENKRTDAVTWREKEDAWAKITSLFNASSPEGIPRAKDSLKKCYDNIKKNKRKEVAQEKTEIKKTGGRPETIITDVSTDLVLDIMNPKTVYGLSNMFDSDYLPSSSYFSNHSYTDGTISAGGCSDAPVDESPMITEEIMEPSKSTPRESAVSEQRQENVNTSKFSANQLRKRISDPLEHKRSKRRRPNIQQLNSSQLSEEYLK
ncbi:hypothetical protein JTB14_034675 [Gonioctena quinquepunctata]|nr:hypothetical protein JTB14_034675 [Gonioctena quinquepunctata]